MYMVEIPLTLTHQPSGQGSNSQSLSHDSTVGYSSPPIIEHEISYQHLRSVRPITHQFAKADELILGVKYLPHTSKKPNATPTGVVVLFVEEEVLAILEGLEEFIEDSEEAPIFFEDTEGTLVVLGSNAYIEGRGEGSRGSEGRDEPTDSDPEPLDSEGEEEDEEDKEMANLNLEWMTQGPLALPAVLHKITKQGERMNIKFKPDNAVKAEDHLDNFYLQLQTLEVCYDDVACRLFPCTLDNCASAWYHNHPPNSIQNWGSFKCMFLENFVDDKTPAMLLKELRSLRMEGKEKVKDFNQRFMHILNKFGADTKPHDFVTIDYYMYALPTTIVYSVKRATKRLLLLRKTCMSLESSRMTNQ